MHVPDARGRASASRWVDNRSALRDARETLSRDAAKEAIRDAVAACAGVAADDPATEGMRWFCGYLLKNNLGQIDAVRARHGGRTPIAGTPSASSIVGDAVDDVQLRNLAFQAQMETVEEGAADLDIGVRILRGLHEPRGLAVPVLAHFALRRPHSGRARPRARRARCACAPRSWRGTRDSPRTACCTSRRSCAAATARRSTTVDAQRRADGVARMKICQVEGTLVATARIGGLQNRRLLVVKERGSSGKQVAVDPVGCKPGDWVIAVGSSAARDAAGSKDYPSDLTIVGIIDYWDEPAPREPEA